MNPYKILYLLIIILWVTGCASSGHVKAIDPGKTTKNDMLVNFGEPTRKISGKEEKWEYDYVKVGAPESKVVKLSVTFDDDGEVDSYSIDVSEEKRQHPEPPVRPLPPPIQPPFRGLPPPR